MIVGEKRKIAGIAGEVEIIDVDSFDFNDKKGLRALGVTRTGKLVIVVGFNRSVYNNMNNPEPDYWH